MGNGGKYIGAPNGIVLCVDRRADGRTRGRMFHSYSRTPIPITSIEGMALSMEELFDRLGFPFPGENERSFVSDNKTTGSDDRRRREEMVKVMNDEELLKEHGDMGTFIIRVQHRQHSSWQGMVTWVEEDKTVSFRSALELIKLIDGALEDEDDESDCNSLTGNQKNV